MDLKESIKALAYDIGISKIGFTTADNFDYLEKSLRLAQENGTSTGFEHKVIEERLDPKLTLASAKTLISIAVAYPNKLPEQPQKSDYKRGKFSPSSWGIDYHHILGSKLERLAEGIKELCQEFELEYEAMVDTGALVDAAVAQRAGIGFIGKNGLVISKEFGSYMFLGELITNLEVEPDQPVDYDCGDCNRCVRSCPTQALNGDSTMNARKCLSFITQDKGIMPVEYRKKIKTVIYGCDICQISCPYNKGIVHEPHTEIDPDLSYPELIPFIELSNKGFKAKYGHVAGSWRGKNILQRNAIIALANSRDRSALPKLLEIVERGNNEVHQATAVWAIGQIQKKPNDELVTFVQNFKTDSDAVEEERQRVLEQWKI